MTIPTLHDWCVRLDGDGYKAPEQCEKYLEGHVFGSPNPSFEDGDHITTSHLDHATGRIVTTRSGSRYRLGRIEPAYRAWLRKQGIPYDPRHPMGRRETPAGQE